MSYDERLARELLHLLEKRAKLSLEEMATMLGSDTATVAEHIEKLEQDKIILSYNALVDWSKLSGDDRVTAMIEVSITPQRDKGFDQIAKRIYRFPEVNACYLMSGGYDLMVIIEAKTLIEVANFVAEKIAPQDYVLSTRTHFILRKYKINGHVLMDTEKDNREAVVL